MINSIEGLFIIDKTGIYIFAHSIVRSHILVKKIPSRVPFPDIKPLCRLLISFSIFCLFLYNMIFKMCFRTWLMRLNVRYSVHIVAFIFLGKRMKMDWFMLVGITQIKFLSSTLGGV